MKKKMSFICFNVIVYVLINSEISKIKLDSFLLVSVFLCMCAEFHLAYAFLFLICFIKQHKKHIVKLQKCSHCLSSDFLNLWFVENSSFTCFGDFHFLSLLISGAYKCVQIDSIISVLPGLLFVIQMSKTSNKNFFFFWTYPLILCSVWCWWVTWEPIIDWV